MKKKIIPLVLIIAALVAYQIYSPGRVDSRGGKLIIYGNVDIREVALGFRVPGRLAKMNFEEGDQVEAGQSLAELDPTPQQNELAVRKAQVKEIEAALVNAEKNLIRLSSLSRRGSAPVSDYDAALAVRDEMRAKLESTKALIAQAETNLNDVVVTAPIDGTILTRVCEPGTIIPVGATVYTLSIDNPVWVRAYIDEPHLGYIHPGQTVRVTTDSGGSYEGRIGFISPKAEFTPKTVETAKLRTDLVYRLRITVDAPDKGLRQGMPVTVEF